MVLATLGALGGQYAMGKIEANSANAMAKKSEKRGAIISNWLAEQSFERQKAWEKERATNAHQWEMEDLKNAGLNPALTAMGGQGASTGSIGGTASYAPTSAKGVHFGKLLDYVNSAKTAEQQDRQLDINQQQMLSNIDKQNAETLNIMKNSKWIDPKNAQELRESESRVLNNINQNAKIVAETRNINENTNQTKGGLIAKAFGTDPTKVQAVMNVASLVGTGGLLGGVAKGVKAYKAFRNAKNFGKFVNAIGK